jgi:tetratricopeptide (TPR) repeat protein
MANIREYLPQSSVGNILITSRHEATKELGSSIVLDAMEEKEALELLLRCISSDAVDVTLPTAKLVIERLGYLPLAIDHARAYITLRQLTFDDFLREYELRKDIVMKASPTLSEYRRSQGSIEKRNTLSVFTTWEMSLEQLLGSVEHPDGIREALQLIGSFYPRGISETLLSAYALDDDKDTETPMTYFIKDGAWDHEKFETLVIWMKTLSLLQFTRLATGEISLIFHPLVAEWLVVKGGRLGIDLVARLSALHVACYATTFSDLGLTGFSLRQQLLTQMNHVFPKMLLLLPNRLLQRIGYLYQELGHWKEAEEMYDRALAGYEKQLGSEHTSTLMTINSLGLLYRDLGRLLEAEQMFNKALIGYEKVFGLDNTETVTIMNNLGIVYRDLGRLSEAEQLYNKALAGYEKALGPEATLTLVTVNNLGRLYQDLGRLKEAEQMLNRALLGREKAFGWEHTSTLDTMNNLGRLYQELGRLKEAEQMLVRALEGSEKALGSEHAFTLNAVNDLGLLYRALGRLEEAERTLDQALEGYEKALGSDHIWTVSAAQNLGILYWDLGRLEEAEPMLNRSLRGREKVLGSEHTLTLSSVNDLGHLYEEMSRPRGAASMYNRALVGYEKTLGETHPKTLDLSNNLRLAQLAILP